MINDEIFEKYPKEWHKKIKRLLELWQMYEHCGDYYLSEKIESTLKEKYGIKIEDDYYDEIYYLLKKYSLIR